jgi:hypothetical protein
MRTRRVGLAFICAAAIGGGTAAGASANGVHLNLEANGEVLAVGAPVVVSGSGFELNSDVGSVSCPDSTLTGTVASNGGSKSATVELSESTFAGEPANSGMCASTFAAPLNEVVVTGVTAQTLPWTMTFLKKGEATIKSQLQFEVSPSEVPPGPHPALSCKYKTGSLKKAAFAWDGAELNLNFANEKIGVGADSSKECGKTKAHPTLSAEFTLSSGGNPVVAVEG